MSRIILVTGGNRSIGYAIVQSLAQHPSFRSSTILIGSRDLQNAQTAIRSLREKGTTNVAPVELDVTSDESIRAAVSHIKNIYHGLDILINNAGVAKSNSASDFSDLREVFQYTYNVNVVSVAMMTNLFLPLLRASEFGGKVIQVSSSRGSMTRSATELLPPTLAMGYGITKTALNALTIELSRLELNRAVEFQLACPGHCSTEFNNFRGQRDPMEGANVVVELAIGSRRKTGFFETKGDSRELIEVPW